ncbi:hypothetical protein BKK49_02105 [Rodentibacter rarus]|uniref:hypothetical protein n=1 Tax=Rodentibacter rarus TaxID=1908260 RepID=UPI000987618B|nr:hypothetical protein [Rodentibacter rarus]OOF42610.1 hypothetical protein BKK49_02105 [Rodentibacter rarus]
MDKREYKIITIDGIEYAIPSFIDGRAGIITPLGKDETGNLKFNYLEREFKAIKLKNVNEKNPCFSKVEKSLAFISLVLILIFSSLVFMGKDYLELTLSLCLIIFCTAYFPIKKYSKIKDFERQSKERNKS